MARFLEINGINPKLKQSELAKELGCSSSTLQRYRQNLEMLSSYRIPLFSNERNQEISNRKHHFERPQMTSKDFKRPKMILKFNPLKVKTISERVEILKFTINV